MAADEKSLSPQENQRMRDLLVNLLKKYDLNQKQVAGHLGITQQSISMFLSGKTGLSPGLAENLRKLALAFDQGVDPIGLWDSDSGADEPSDEPLESAFLHAFDKTQHTFRDLDSVREFIGSVPIRPSNAEKWQLEKLAKVWLDIAAERRRQRQSTDRLLMIVELTLRYLDAVEQTQTPQDIKDETPQKQAELYSISPALMKRYLAFVREFGMDWLAEKTGIPKSVIDMAINGDEISNRFAVKLQESIDRLELEAGKAIQDRKSSQVLERALGIGRQPVRRSVFPKSEASPQKPPPQKQTAARCHELQGDRNGQFASDLDHPLRLVFVPEHDPVPTKTDGGVDREQITAIRILEIVDYH